MNAPLALNQLFEAEEGSPRLREIPYNYTSFSDREIVIRILGEESWPVSYTHLTLPTIYSV